MALEAIQTVAQAEARAKADREAAAAQAKQQLAEAQREARQLVDEARQVARNYGGGGRGRFSRLWGDLNPAVYTLMGAGATGLLWMIAALG